MNNSPLINILDIKGAPAEKQGESPAFSARTKGAVKCDFSTKLESVIGYVVSGETVVFANQGGWSGHNILQHLLQYTGPAQVWLSSWAISEGPMRQIIKLVENGYITKLECLFDIDVKKKNPNGFQLAMANMRIGLGSNHSKVIVIKGETRSYVCISSQNLSKNRRWEAGVIINDHLVADATANWIANEVSKTLYVPEP